MPETQGLGFESLSAVDKGRELAEVFITAKAKTANTVAALVKHLDR
jgi:hypothetical protein